MSSARSARFRSLQLVLGLVAILATMVSLVVLYLLARFWVGHDVQLLHEHYELGVASDQTKPQGRGLFALTFFAMFGAPPLLLAGFLWVTLSLLTKDQAAFRAERQRWNAVVSSIVCVTFSSCAPPVGERPVVVPGTTECRTRPAWSETLRTRCETATDDLCAWFPVVESWTAGATESSEIDREIAQGFGLSPDSARRVRVATRGLFPVLLESICGKADFERLFDLASVEDWLPRFDSTEGIALLLLIQGADPTAAEHLLASENGSDAAPMLRALQAFVRLLEAGEVSADALDLVRQMPIMGEPTVFPASEGWPESLRSIAGRAEAIDRTLIALDSESIDAFHRSVEKLIETEPRRERAILWVRVGFGLVLRGLLEDAALALLRAEREFRAICRPCDRTARFVRIFGASQRMAVALAWGRPQDAERIFPPLEHAAVGRLERWMLDAFGLDRLIAAGTDGAFKTGMDAIDEILPDLMSGRLDAEQPAFDETLLLAFPGFASSGPRPIVRQAPRPGLVALLKPILLGDQTEARQQWLRLMERTAFPELAIWPASLVRVALQRGDVPAARRALDDLLDALETSTIDARHDDVARAQIHLVEGRFYAAAVELAFLDQRPDEAFALAERGRSFVLRRSFGSRLPEAGTLPSDEERDLVRSIVDLERGRARAEPSEGARLRERFESARFERRLGATESLATSAREPTPASTPLETISSTIVAPGETLVSYFTSDRKLWIWIIRRDGWTSLSVPWDDEQQTMTLDHGRLATVRGGELLGDRVTPARRRLARRLYDRLIAPLGDHLRPGDRLVVVPHGVLHRVPWAALEASDGRSLVDDHSISVVPSVELFAVLRAGPTTR